MEKYVPKFGRGGPLSPWILVGKCIGNVETVESYLEIEGI